VLFCIGSDHPVTVEQQRHLLALGRGECMVLNLSVRQTSLERVRESIESAAPTALVLSGGDTASLVCRALGVRRIELEDEIVPGIPWGYLCGGAFDGSRVATKSGGFGAPHALIQVADFFTCPKP
jgi:uncharacterized protein YgbK (DUF1537 family)